ncbi:MAG: hypothetical protein FJ303_00335 [Planctomycetes bacterium]|nr:hypothetical protein [Planctomycetota bacterium]
MIERIRDLYWAKPFRPFTLQLAAGDAVTVGHPELMALSESTNEVVVLEPDGAAHFVNLAQVTQVKVTDKKSKSAK